MKITLIGSTAYKDKFNEYADFLRKQEHEVFIPAFDSRPDLDEVGICAHNLFLIEKADEVHIIWDGRSTGTIFDFGMCFALRKKTKIAYINPKTMTNLFVKYSAYWDFVENSEKAKKVAEEQKKEEVTTVETASESA